ncbi:hypothetical protein BH11PSE9_BH11PSE9_30220 [soil metagenome]
MHNPLTSSALTYGGCLANAGGRELRATAPDDDSVAVAMYTSPPYDVVVPPLGVARLSINLSPARVTGGVDGHRSRAFQTRRHSLFLTPAGAAAAWRKASSSRHINIYFHARAFAQSGDMACGPLLGDSVPLLNARLPGASALMDMLAEELAQPQPFGAEAIDSLARLILVRLARVGIDRAERTNPLTPMLQARLLDHVMAHLDQRLLVSDMACVTGLAPNRFAQAFISARGQTPHQFVMQLRLERALELLRGSSLFLADIAAACGFASQQHMTQTMRRRLGTTPARERDRERESHTESGSQP